MPTEHLDTTRPSSDRVHDRMSGVSQIGAEQVSDRLAVEQQIAGLDDHCRIVNRPLQRQRGQPVPRGHDQVVVIVVPALQDRGDPGLEREGHEVEVVEDQRARAIDLGEDRLDGLGGRRSDALGDVDIDPVPTRCTELARRIDEAVHDGSGIGAERTAEPRPRNRPGAHICRAAF